MYLKASSPGRKAGRGITQAGSTGGGSCHWHCIEAHWSEIQLLLTVLNASTPFLNDQGHPVPTRMKRQAQTPWDPLNRYSSHRLWTDEDNYNLIKDHYAWFLDTYESLSKPVMKADSARYLYMYHIGGADLLCSST